MSNKVGVNVKSLSYLVAFLFLYIFADTMGSQQEFEELKRQLAVQSSQIQTLVSELTTSRAEQQQAGVYFLT